MCQLGLDQGDPGARRQRGRRVRKGKEGQQDGLKPLVQCWVGLGLGGFLAVLRSGVGAALSWQAAPAQLKTLKS